MKQTLAILTPPPPPPPPHRKFVLGSSAWRAVGLLLACFFFLLSADSQAQVNLPVTFAWDAQGLLMDMPQPQNNATYYRFTISPDPRSAYFRQSYLHVATRTYYGHHRISRTVINGQSVRHGDKYKVPVSHRLSASLFNGSVTYTVTVEERNGTMPNSLLLPPTGSVLRSASHSFTTPASLGQAFPPVPYEVVERGPHAIAIRFSAVPDASWYRLTHWFPSNNSPNARCRTGIGRGRADFAHQSHKYSGAQPGVTYWYCQLGASGNYGFSIRALESTGHLSGRDIARSDFTLQTLAAGETPVDDGLDLIQGGVDDSDDPPGSKQGGPIFSLNFSDITSSSVRVAWNNIGAYGYILSYSAVGGASNSLSLPAGTTSQTLSGLTAGADYEVFLYAVFADGTFSQAGRILSMPAGAQQQVQQPQQQQQAEQAQQQQQPPPTNTLPPPTNTLPPPTNTLPPPTNTLPPPTNTLPPPTNTLPPPTDAPPQQSSGAIADALVVSFSDVTHDAVTVNWNRRGGSDVAYYLSISGDGSVNTFTAPSYERSHRFSGLSAGTEYKVYVDAYKPGNGATVELVLATVRTADAQLERLEQQQVEEPPPTDTPLPPPTDTPLPPPTDTPLPPPTDTPLPPPTDTPLPPPTDTSVPQQAEQQAVDQQAADAQATQDAQQAADRAAQEAAQQAADAQATQDAQRAADQQATQAAVEQAAQEAQEAADAQATQAAVEQAAQRAADQQATQAAVDQAAQEAANAQATQAAIDQAAREAQEAAQRAADQQATQAAVDQAAREAQEAAQRAADQQATQAAVDQAAREAQEAAQRAADQQATQVAIDQWAAAQQATQQAEQAAADQAAREAQEAADRAAREAQEAAERAAADAGRDLKISFSDVSQDSLTVNWNKMGGGDVAYYLSLRGGDDRASFTAPSHERSQRFSGLSAGTEYEIYIEAYKPSNGETIDSTTVKVRTSD